jgi:hypothetical protein
MTMRVPELIDATCAACSRLDTYRLEAQCMNCGWRGEVRFTVGHDKETTTCPRCRCKRKVYAGGFLGVDAA